MPPRAKGKARAQGGPAAKRRRLRAANVEETPPEQADEGEREEKEDDAPLADAKQQEPVDEDDDDDDAPLEALIPKAKMKVVEARPEAAANTPLEEAAADAPAEQAEAGATADNSDSDSDSDDESSSSSSSSSKEEEPQDDDDDSSSSSSSSSSESEDEDEEMAASVREEEEEASAEAVEEEEKKNPFEMLKSAYLRRDDILWFLRNFAEDEARRVIEKAFIRIVQEKGCLIAQIAAVERAEKPYKVTRSDGSSQIVGIQVVGARADSKRNFRLSNLSNHDIQESEFENWRQYVDKRTQNSAVASLETIHLKAEAIKEAWQTEFTEEHVSALMNSKPKIEFNAQKESRMLSDMQCAISQMEIAGMKDNDAGLLEKSYREAQDVLAALGTTTVKLQEDWFEQRAGMYSLKEINARNLKRQAAREVRALDFVRKMENDEKPALNPFERRACRPMNAWDTSLSELPTA